jgi:hypothetical protein
MDGSGAVSITEPDAREKDCRIAGMIEVRKPLHQPVFPKCIASQCMGWVPTELPLAATTSPISGRIITQAQPGRGFCGYAKGPSR